MKTSAQSRATSSALATLLLLGLLSTPALAQGTAEQREACAPDAVRLCQDTIPDVDKTTVCMKAHEAELTPRCRRVFDAATGEPASRRRRRIARAPAAEPVAPGPAIATPVIPTPDLNLGAGLGLGQLNVPTPDVDVDAGDTAKTRAENARKASRIVGRLCRDNVIDPQTCRLTQSAIELSR